MPEDIEEGLQLGHSDQAVESVGKVRRPGAPERFFFFSRRRRHTGFDCDWSSDVCSSDLPHGIGQEAIRVVKEQAPDLVVMTDVCLCEYTSHGHCGVVEDGRVVNDPSLELLARTAVSHVEAGADLVAPSDMMDGRVGAIRRALDASGFLETPILAYAAKFASAFYGPFREAADSTPQFGDRRAYQMDPANAREALREVELDVAEGADLGMVKPALPYLDLVWRVRERFGLPVVAYNVSGEFAIVTAAAPLGSADE